MSKNQNKLYLPKPELFSFEECLWFLDRGYDDCLYHIEDRAVTKPLRLAGENMLIRVSERGNELKVRLLAGNLDAKIRPAVIDFVTEWFDLNRSLRPFYNLLRQDEDLRHMPDSYRGLRLVGIPDLYEALCWCVIGQQINLTFAYALKRKLVEAYGETITCNSRTHYLFPRPEVLAGLRQQDLKNLQFSRQKAEYITGISIIVAEGRLNKDLLKSLDSVEQMRKRLREIRGVGEWTANYVLMKSLKMMSCIPYGDVGLLKALEDVKGIKRTSGRKAIEQFFEPFTEWESYLVFYLWRTLATD